MKFKALATITGATQFAGNIDGENIEANTIFVVVDLNPKQGGYGTRTEPKRCASPELLNSIKHNPFPFDAELELEELATKGKTQMMVTAIRPVGRTPAKAAA
jgi:hypothetical protein